MKKTMTQKARPRLPETPVEAADAAGLRYVSDQEPGIRRVRAGRGMRYVDAAGKPVVDRAALDRIKLLRIPPAYRDVWICPYENGHLQATGRDARGRKQYRYHERWREVRDAGKFDRAAQFAAVLPIIRERTAHDLALPGMPREKLLAAVVRLLESTLIRVGNEEYAKENQSYGLTTLQNEHAQVNGTRIVFHFRGKSGKEHEIGLDDRRLARIVRKCQELPGQTLFEYFEDGKVRSIDSSDVNAYLKEITGDDFTAKDFRTWAGTVLAAQALGACDQFKSETEAKRNIVRAIKMVAERLGNTPAVCRKCYVHPDVIRAYLGGDLAARLAGLVGEGCLQDALQPRS